MAIVFSIEDEHLRLAKSVEGLEGTVLRLLVEVRDSSNLALYAALYIRIVTGL